MKKKDYVDSLFKPKLEKIIEMIQGMSKINFKERQS